MCVETDRQAAVYFTFLPRPKLHCRGGMLDLKVTQLDFNRPVVIPHIENRRILSAIPGVHVLPFDAWQAPLHL